jgi:hypothetical protein
MEAVNSQARSVHVRSGLKTIDETSRIKDRDRWTFIGRVAGGKENESGVKERESDKEEI